tara:strand:+ start:271 stop:492 length:222 start_codon:yes stop_codon:yes gene_type:complete
MNPLGQFTAEDWVVVFMLEGGKFRRIGVSPEATEEQALESAKRLLRPDEVPQVVDTIIGRRHSAMNHKLQIKE